MLSIPVDIDIETFKQYPNIATTAALWDLEDEQGVAFTDEQLDRFSSYRELSTTHQFVNERIHGGGRLSLAFKDGNICFV